jgi:hypothetical protein
MSIFFDDDNAPKLFNDARKQSWCINSIIMMMKNQKQNKCTNRELQNSRNISWKTLTPDRLIEFIF